MARNPAWPAACYSPGSCFSHRECMYVRCLHKSKTKDALKAEMDEAEKKAEEKK